VSHTRGATAVPKLVLQQLRRRLRRLLRGATAVPKLVLQQLRRRLRRLLRRRLRAWVLTSTLPGKSVTHPATTVVRRTCTR
jgi:hypothetical protein